MKRTNRTSALLCLATGTMLAFNARSQTTNTAPGSPVDNLVLPADYKTSEYGAIPAYVKSGEGARPVILIPGLGFDESVFADFAAANQKRYTMYRITVPGFGKTSAPPAPKEGTSFGEQTWNKSVLEGLNKLIAREKLVKPVILGHFTLGTQLALRMAIDYPEQVGAVIIAGGPGKFIPIQNGKIIQYPLASRIKGTDKFSAAFYRGISKSTWDAGNYLPRLYSTNDHTGNDLWKQVASVPLKVLVRYLCEFQAADVTVEIDKIHCPVLVLRPGFAPDLIAHPDDANVNYIKPQFIDSWEEVRKANPLVEIQDIPNSGACIWKDQPTEFNRRIDQFFKDKPAI